jgi:preprotein translocase subunit SecG
MDPALAQAIATLSGALAVLILALANYVNNKSKHLDDEDDEEKGE